MHFYRDHTRRNPGRSAARYCVSAVFDRHFSISASAGRGQAGLELLWDRLHADVRLFQFYLSAALFRDTGILRVCDDLSGECGLRAGYRADRMDISSVGQTAWVLSGSFGGNILENDVYKK